MAGNETLTGVNRAKIDFSVSQKREVLSKGHANLGDCSRWGLKAAAKSAEARAVLCKCGGGEGVVDYPDTKFVQHFLEGIAQES